MRSPRKRSGYFDVEATVKTIQGLEPNAIITVGEPGGESSSREIRIALNGCEDSLLLHGIHSEEVRNGIVECLVLSTWNSDDQGGIYQTDDEPIAVLGARIAVALGRENWHIRETSDGYW